MTHGEIKQICNIACDWCLIEYDLFKTPCFGKTSDKERIDFEQRVFKAQQFVSFYLNEWGVPFSRIANILGRSVGVAWQRAEDCKLRMRTDREYSQIYHKFKQECDEMFD